MFTNITDLLCFFINLGLTTPIAPFYILFIFKYKATYQLKLIYCLNNQIFKFHSQQM